MVSKQFIMAWHTQYFKSPSRKREALKSSYSDGLLHSSEGFFFERLTLTSNLSEISEESPSEEVDHPSTPPPQAIPAPHIKMFKKPQKQTTRR